MTPAVIDARRHSVVGVLCAAILVLGLTGCATPPALREQPVSDTGPWSGRLSLTVETEPPQGFYAGFTLQGNADAGDLALTSPLGSTLAALRWQPGSAELDRGGQIQTYASLDDLAARVTGAPMPMRALFDWLRGQNAVIDGWQADLSALTQGRLTAQRIFPPPAVRLRMVLDY